MAVSIPCRRVAGSWAPGPASGNMGITLAPCTSPMTTHTDDHPTDRYIDGDQIDFGYERVARSDNPQRVGEVFDSVAARYGLMHDLVSLGIHRAWNHFTQKLAGVRPGEHLLELAGGTGALA